MTVSYFSKALVALSLLTAGASLAQPTPLLAGGSAARATVAQNNKGTAMNAQTNAIQNVILAYGEAAKNADASKVVSLYTSDGVFIPSGGPVSAGRSQLQQAYVGLFQNISLDIKFTFKEVTVSGDLAFVHTESRGTILLKATNQAVPEKNQEFFILRREQGEWKIARYMFIEEK